MNDSEEAFLLKEIYRYDKRWENIEEQLNTTSHWFTIEEKNHHPNHLSLYKAVLNHISKELKKREKK